MIVSFRSECLDDWNKLLQAIISRRLSIIYSKAFTDFKLCSETIVELQIENLKFDDFMDIIRTIPDGHVMLQTCKESKIEDNTMERNYNLT